MTEQEQAREKIPSRTLIERILEMADGFEREPFGPKMFEVLSNLSRLRLDYVRNYLGYSVTERRVTSDLLDQVDKLYDDQLQIARNREYHRLLGASAEHRTGS
jgi:hypothetical protein